MLNWGTTKAIRHGVLGRGCSDGQPHGIAASMTMSFPLWQTVVGKTESLPWQLEKLGDNVELRWIPEYAAHGCFLIESGIWAGSVRQGVSRGHVELLKANLKTWVARHAQLLSAQQRLRLVVVVGTHLDELCMLPEGRHPATVPPEEGNPAVFLILLPLPATIRSAEKERGWLCGALAHELEHVKQLVVAGRLRLPLTWRCFAEVCAVLAERELRSGSKVFLEFGHELLSGFPRGLLHGCRSTRAQSLLLVSVPRAFGEVRARNSQQRVASHRRKSEPGSVRRRAMEACE